VSTAKSLFIHRESGV
jgi:hypothetical protein